MEDVAYGSHALQAVDFFWPDAEEPQSGWPVVAGFHGKYGDKKHMHGFCQQTILESESTRACMPANYRDKGFSFGVKAKDVALSLKWLVNNAASYHVDNTMIMLYGYSQGGMIVDSAIWSENALVNAHVSAVIFSAGVGKHSGSLATADHRHPPILMIHSEDDGLVGYKHSDALLDKLAPLGGIVHRLTYLTAGHHPQGEPSFFSQIDAFLDSPSTYEAPDPLSLTTTPVPLACKGLCYKHKAEWSKKCSWSDCGSCDECAPSPASITTLSPTFPCDSVCHNDDMSLAKRCSWKACDGCEHCHLPTPSPTLPCDSSCYNDDIALAKRCTWKVCGGCGHCTDS